MIKGTKLTVGLKVVATLEMIAGTTLVTVSNRVARMTPLTAVKIVAGANNIRCHKLDHGTKPGVILNFISGMSSIGGTSFAAKLLRGIT